MAKQEATNYASDRRQFLSRLIGFLVALVTAMLGVPLLLFSILPPFRRTSRRWLELGSVTDVKPGRPQAFLYRYHQFDGYLGRLVRGTVYVVTSDRLKFEVFSNICPHLACSVRWEDDRKAFFCPCHNALFDANGRVTGGPAPRPLDRLPHKVENGKIFVRVQEA